MGDTTINYIIIGVMILIILFVYFKYNEIKNRKEFINRIKRQWGKEPTRSYSSEQLEGIKRYFINQRKTEFFIDDITWNDLDMNSVFKLLNNTNSSIGEQYLYYILRTPQFDKEKLEERKKMIDFLEQNEEIRLRLQCIYGEIGRMGTFSLSDYIYNLADLEIRSNVLEFGMLFLGIFSIIAAITIPTYGVLIFIGVLILNISQYYRRKGEVEPYFVSISYINKLLIGSDSFVKEIPKEFIEYANRAKKIKNQFKRFRRNAKWIKSGKKATGSMGDMILDYIKMFFHIDLIKFNYLLSEVKEKIRYIDEMIEIMGSVEAYIAIASFRGLRESYCIPEFVSNEKPMIEINDVYHPMIYEPVVNSIKEEKSVLITGSNASGKSTFLKTVAINAILSQTIYMAMAKKYKTNFYRVFSSMALTDDLMGNESYYIVEIKSLKRILDASKKDIPILCFIDEVLRGTNTVERIAASAQILNSLIHRNVMCFAATHDIELTHILEDIYSNYHFEEEVKDNDILFSYELKKGRATSKNAIKLLNIIGYEQQIIEHAELSAAEFMKNNRWEKLC